MAADPNPQGLDPDVRPPKRPRFSLSPIPTSRLAPPSCSSPNIPLPSSLEKPVLPLRPLPLPLLLLSLPAILILPPSHLLHDESLRLSVVALRKCVLMRALSPEIECRAWTTLAQVGLQVIDSRLSASSHERHAWARNMEAEVDRAITKGHSSLQKYKYQITLAHAQFSLWQQKPKFSLTLLRRLAASVTVSNVPQVEYLTYLKMISQHLSLNEVHTALTLVDKLRDSSSQYQHSRITLLSHILRLRILILGGHWSDAGPASRTAEDALGLRYETASTLMSTAPTVSPMYIDFEDRFECAMALHTLVLSIVYYAHTGISSESSTRLSHLHALLDAKALECLGDGSIKIDFPTGPPIHLEATHPRIFYLVGFLLTSVSKRDAMGRKPRRKLFAIEGLKAWEKETTKPLDCPSSWSISDITQLRIRLAKIKADILCELVAVSVVRSEFDAAEKEIDVLIAHTRTWDVFDEFSARIALHHSHLAHSLGKSTEALTYYTIASALSEAGGFVDVAATLGHVELLIGLSGRSLVFPVHGSGENDTRSSLPANTNNEEFLAFSSRAVRLTKGMGSTLEAAGKVIQAATSTEILRAKQYLKDGLSKASRSQDNHLRALIMALVSSHYFHTAYDQAEQVLSTCEQLAAGLGAPSDKVNSNEVPTLGNIQLGIWVSERTLELYNRCGKMDMLHKQRKKVEYLRGAFASLHKSKFSGSSDVI
ncbi:hypothetical protein BDM02DRAFT_3090718 [Thelephora ganbajun]|uniref:Uncharacterized protein n=1 Tax=Thelephora ganbajun TaxID=370292 RepID=A0ACB6ZPJ5_THEGA|nr:hypothetical protein BDM02DRAFT_3090718 [Thelephora ganbajun]